jgi:tryptophan synthase alpha chain
MLEVGIPFSDPVADGPVIQAAARRALDGGVRVDDTFALIARLRADFSDLPIGILTYANLVMSRGPENFFERASAAGVDSLLIADLPAREAEPWTSEMRVAGIEPVMIAASNTPPETLRTIARLGAGYTYCVTRAGITGVHSAGDFDCTLIAGLARAKAPPPVFGFGIGRPDQVRAALGAGAAGVISGSAIIAQAAAGGDIRGLVGDLKSATRNAIGF